MVELFTERWLISVEGELLTREHRRHIFSLSYLVDVSSWRARDEEFWQYAGCAVRAPTADIVLEASAAETVDVSLVVRDVESVSTVSGALTISAFASCRFSASTTLSQCPLSGVYAIPFSCHKIFLFSMTSDLARSLDAPTTV